MKVTSDRIKARAQQLRNNGFRLSGSMVRSTLELNAGARTLQPSPTATAPKKTENQANEPKNVEAA
ncbi:MAG TPA: hypothetical protein VGQ12_09005 [Candidatus Angelobacter sp.]|nr:hypothetical protein [Candidatus Angelobacter sp.]